MVPTEAPTPRAGEALVRVEACGLEVASRRLATDEITILGSRYTSRWELTEAARLVAEGRIRPVVSEVVPLARVTERHAKLRARTLFGRGAIAFRSALGRRGKRRNGGAEGCRT